jgi:hypothetical protein
MTNNVNYLDGRKRSYGRPQAILWSENPGVVLDNFYVPLGFEVGASIPEGTDAALVDQFLILSDDNRSPLSFSNNRIESRQRMINGRMRSYYTADKLTLNVSWQRLPSRSFSTYPGFDENGKPLELVKEITFDEDDNAVEFVENPPGTGVKIIPSGSPYYKDQQYTTDGGAGGVEVLDWYNNHPNSFWVFLAYDNYSNFQNTEDPYSHLKKYNQVVEMFISDFSYTVDKRGTGNYDFWDISLSLEEV